jgi:hypothetical protein
MFADLSTFIDGFLYSESTTKLSKINNSHRYKTIHDHRQSDQIGLSQARRRTPAPCGRLVRFRGIHNIRDRSSSSTKIARIFAAINYRQRQSVTVDFEICVYSCLPRRSVTKEGSFVVTIS